MIFPVAPSQHLNVLDRAERMLQWDPQVETRNAVSDLFLKWHQETEGAENILNRRSAIYALVNHPTFLDGPKLFQALSQANVGLPVAGMTWLENFVGLPGKFVGKRSCTYPIQREIDPGNKYFQKMYGCISKDLLAAGAAMNEKITRRLIELLMAGKINLVAAATSTHRDVRDADSINQRTIRIIMDSGATVIPVSFRNKPGSVIHKTITTFHPQIDSRIDPVGALQAVSF